MFIHSCEVLPIFILIDCCFQTGQVMSSLQESTLRCPRRIVPLYINCLSHNDFVAGRADHAFAGFGVRDVIPMHHPSCCTSIWSPKQIGITQAIALLLSASRADTTSHMFALHTAQNVRAMLTTFRPRDGGLQLICSRAQPPSAEVAKEEVHTRDRRSHKRIVHFNGGYERVRAVEASIIPT